MMWLSTYCMCCNVHVNVNPGSPPQAYDRGLSNHTGDSDNSNSFPYHSDIIWTLQIVDILDLLGEDSDSES